MTQPQLLPIGFSDFKDLRTSNRYYIDKSLFINELMADGAKVVLLPRPRRFGKTLNLSMLRYFFDCTENQTHLFQGLAITKTAAWPLHQGQYPVLFLSFKELKLDSFESNIKIFRRHLLREADKHQYLLQSTQLSQYDKASFKGLFEETDADLLTDSLLLLTKLLFQHHGKPVVLLLDEYDTPLINAYSNGWYNTMVTFMRNLLSAAFKDNQYLAKGVITGILRVAKESIFSGLNNIRTYTVAHQAYNTQFGLTATEVQQALASYGLAGHYAAVEAWYHGYLFGGTPIYNPWSIVNYLAAPAEGLQPYWVNTSNNDLIASMLASADNHTLQQIELIVQGQPVETRLNEHTVFADLDRAEATTLLTFLVFSGYLKAQLARQDDYHNYYQLALPNKEVKSVYSTILEEFLTAPISASASHELIQYLLMGQADAFTKTLQQYILAAFSYFDVAEPQAERVYHGFMLGVLALLHTTHQILSNRETGLGRADMLLMPRSANDNRAYVLEFKQAPGPEKLPATAQNALNQISNQRYTTLMTDQGKTQLLHYGIAFSGKQVYVALKNN